MTTSRFVKAVAIQARDVPLRVVDSFWRRVEKTETCWLWRGYIERTGYGRVGSMTFPGAKNGQPGMMFAHRLSYLLTSGYLPEWPQVLDHPCNNRKCVRPEHLQVVAQAYNSTRNGAAGAAAKN